MPFDQINNRRSYLSKRIEIEDLPRVGNDVDTKEYYKQHGEIVIENL